MPEITHFWTLIQPSNPPVFYLKDATGQAWQGTYEQHGAKVDLWGKVSPPQPLIGYHPETGEFGYSFGEWRPIGEIPYQEE